MPTNSGTIDTWTGSLSSDWNTGGNWSLGAPPTSGDSVVIPAGSPNDATLANATLNNEPITLGSGTNAGTLILTDVTLDSPLAGSGTIVTGGTFTLGTNGTLTPQNTITLAATGAATAFVNDGTIDATAGNYLFIDNGGTTGSATLSNNGVIEANGGGITIESANPLNPNSVAPEQLQNAGTVMVADGGSVFLNGTLAGGTVAFGGTGVLTLEQGMAFTEGAVVTGFGTGDQIDLLTTAAGKGGTLSFANGTLDVSVGGTLVQAVPFSGSYGLGNFEQETVAGSGNASEIIYAPAGGPSNVAQPDIVAPGSGTVTQGGTLDLTDVTINHLGTVTGSLQIDAGTGTLFMNGASGSGTHRLSVSGTQSQLNADLASLTYVPAAGASTDSVEVIVTPPAPLNTARWIPISINNGGSTMGDPTLTEPSSETVGTDGTIAVSGSYADPFAASNPGLMYLGITDSSGTLSAIDAEGSVVAGSGTNSLSVDVNYADANAILQSLTYTAGANAGSDSIHFDIWDQAGTETTGNVPVTVTAGGGDTTETWTGAVSGDWNNAANWSGGAVPGPGDTAVIRYGTSNVATLSNTVLNNETVDLALPAQPQPGPTLDLSGVTLGAGSVLETTNPTGSSNLASINVSNGLTVDAGATVTSPSNVGQALFVSDTGPIVNDGTISNTGFAFANGGTVVNNGLVANFSMWPNTTIVNAGTVLCTSGIELQSGDLISGGTVLVANSLMQTDGSFAGADVVMSGSAVLQLETTHVFQAGASLSGFGPGDTIVPDITGNVTNAALSLVNGTLDVVNAGSVTEAIPLNGSYSIGDFEYKLGLATNQIVSAPDGGFANGIDPDIAAPASVAVSHGGTLDLGSVAVQNNTTIDTAMTITAASGTLYMNGASGSGSGQLTVTGSNTQVNADLASLQYVPAAGSSSDTLTLQALVSGLQGQGSYNEAADRWIPITVTAGSSNGPTLTEPSSESVAPDSAVAVSGSYSDSFAAGNPGAMYLSIGDSSGTLTARYPNGASDQTVTGSGSAPIVFEGSYADVQDILTTLTYTAGASPGSDSIHFDIWNQAGTETTGNVPVTITGPGNGQTETWTGAVSGDWNTPGNWSYGAVPTSGQTAVIPGDTGNNAALSNAVLSGETITLDDSVAAPTVNFANVTLGSGSLLDGSGGQIDVNGTLTIASGATYAPTGYVTVFRANSSSPTTVVNDGIIESTGTDGIGSLGDIVVNNGTILDTAGYAHIAGTLLNNGSALIHGGGLEVDGTIVGGTVDLSGGGNLQLAAPMALTGGATVTGFSQGSEISVFQPIDALSFSDNTLDISAAGTVVEAIRLDPPNFTLGNFEVEHAINVPFSSDSAVVFAASGQPSGAFSATDVADISAPATGTIAAGGTLSLGDVSITSGGTMTLSITAGSGTLSMNGASGNGTNHLTIGAETPQSQINADLSSLAYVAAPGASNSLDTVEITADTVASPEGTIETSRYIPISVTGGSSPGLHEPASESVTAGGTVAVAGSYNDSFAAGNPGFLYLGITDSSGTLSATNAAGQAVAGSGTNSIGLGASYTDVNAILASLHYTAGSSAGSDAINFDVWNQAGKETTGSTAMAIGSSGASMTMADFASPTTTPSGTTGGSTGSGSMSNMMMAGTTQPIGVPLTLSH